MDSKHTQTPWYLIATDGADFTAISTKPEIKQGDPRWPEKYDPENEVLGSSEWLRCTEDDLKFIVTACNAHDQLVAALKNANDFLKNDFVFDASCATFVGSEFLKARMDIDKALAAAGVVL